MLNIVDKTYVDLRWSDDRKNKKLTVNKSRWLNISAIFT